MKTIRQTIMWLVLALGLTSCYGAFYELKADVLRNVQKGMTKHEVTALLGEPQFRRFDRDLDEWEYSKYVSGSGYTTIILSFEDNKVVAMDSFRSADCHSTPSVTVAPGEVVVTPPITIYVKGMRASEFQRFYDRVKSRTFKDSMLEEMATGADYSLNCNQCARLMSLFNFDDEKMKVLRIFAPNIADRENYKEILDELISLFEKDDAKKLLKVDNYRF